MALREQTAARLVGFDELGATMQISTLEAIEADLRRALSADVPAGAHGPAGGVGAREQERDTA